LTENPSAYLAALRAGLEALAPNADFVPLREGLATLSLLDPALSGDLAAPAELDPSSGMPSVGWLLRALGALSSARSVGEAELARALRLDPEVGLRMQARQRVADVQEVPVLPTSRLRGAIRRRGVTTDFLLVFDRLTTDSHWLRTRVDLTGPAGWEERGPVCLLPDGSVRLDEGLTHLLGRHLHTPISALCFQIQDGTGALVTRLSRGRIGPFWFPGQGLPEGVPPILSSGLVLHASKEILDRTITRSAQNDPLGVLRGGREDVLPEEMGLVRERRFAASPALHPSLLSWSSSLGCAVTVARLAPGG